MPTHTTRPAVPSAAPADQTSDLAALRQQIDAMDAQMLDILQRRIDLAREIGRTKPLAPGEGVAFRPDREAAVVNGLLTRADPAMKPLVAGVWREIMSAGLAAQGPMDLMVWRGPERRVGIDAARRRFGASARYVRAGSPKEALDAASEGKALAVLALESSEPWWIELAEARPDLWVCEALSAAEDPTEPDALVVGRLPPSSLAPGKVVSVSGGGGGASWSDAPSRTLAMHEGWRLTLDLAHHAALLDAEGRSRGAVGRIG